MDFLSIYVQKSTVEFTDDVPIDFNVQYLKFLKNTSKR